MSRSRFVQEDYAEELPIAGQGDLESLAQAGLHLSRLVEDLLAFARIEVQNGVRAQTDPSLLELVLRNLVENACKYSNESVRIEFGAEARNGVSTYRVRDNGIGFDMADAERVFEPFQRLRQNVAQGTGIGLANVRRIVERHGGRIWAESEPGKGSTFLFTLV